VQVAEALEYAHKQGIHHRDIKPSNLLLDRQGTVWVTDFGLAKADDQQNLTHTGDVLGTLRYMPPEAFEGKSDARGDVYSLGLTLYELLVFRPAFEERERNRLVKQVTTTEPFRLRKLNRQVPQDLETIVHKAIDKDPGRRYASAAALAEDLERFLADEPIQARRVSNAERSWRWCRRNPVVACLAAALVLVFLTAFAAVAWKWQEAERQKDLALAAEQGEAQQRGQATAQAERASQEADQARRLLYASDLNLAGQAWEAGDTGHARALLERQWPEPGQPDLRGFEWRYFWQQCQDASRQTFRGHTSEVHAISFTPNGRTMATSGEDHRVCLWDLATQRHSQLLGFRPGAVAFAPDGKTLAVGVWLSKSVRIWDLDRAGSLLPFRILLRLSAWHSRPTASSWPRGVRTEARGSGTSPPVRKSRSSRDSLTELNRSRSRPMGKRWLPRARRRRCGSGRWPAVASWASSGVTAAQSLSSATPPMGKSSPRPAWTPPCGYGMPPAGAR
jgi:hypothetical protein